MTIFSHCQGLAEQLGWQFHQDTDDGRVVYVINDGTHERRMAPGHCRDELTYIAQTHRTHVSRIEQLAKSGKVAAS